MTGKSHGCESRFEVSLDLTCCRRADQSRAGHLEYSWEFFLIEFSVMGEYLPNFESVDDFEPEYTDEELRSLTRFQVAHSPEQVKGIRNALHAVVRVTLLI